MGSRIRVPVESLREHLAQEAARLMIENGIEDFGLAKRKAAERLGVRRAGALPSNSQIQASVAERQRIFEPEEHERRLAKLRELALEMMTLLVEFEPRLAGAVLSGTATDNSPVELHLFTDAPEMVAAALEAAGIAVRDCQRRYRSRNGVEIVPGFSFAVDGEVVFAMIFPERRVHEAPLSPVDRRPMKRATRAQVLALVRE